MKRLALIFLLFAVPASAQENSGLDELVTREDLRGFEPVGRVEIGGGGFCTGALVAADLVLTAAHCVVLPDGSPVDAASIVFKAGFSYGTSLAEVPVSRTIADPDYRNLSPVPVEMVERDVALLQLAQPIPSSVISPFAIARPGADDAVSVVSYAEGRADALSWQRACKVVAQRNRLIAVDCDVNFGSSGAPVLDLSGYRAKIVSIISAGGDIDGRAVSFGVELPEIVDRLKAALRRGEALSVADPGGATTPDLAPSGMPGKPVKRILPDRDATTGTGTGARFVSP